MNAIIAAPRALGLMPIDHPPPGMFEAIFRALETNSLSVIGPARIQLMAIPIHDDDGAVAGGFWGATIFQWLRIQLLIVPEILRGQGAGTALMRAAEAEARARGCLGAFVDVFNFQAVEFYQKLGYTQFGELADFPPGHHQIYLFKRF
jgi:GNAT superfamily N-acetyltransferase